MSKAFVKEDDGQEDEEESPGGRIPAGGKNYITPGGLRRLKEELQFLLDKERPKVTAVVTWAAGNGDRSENADYIYGKRRLREIDRRIRFLTKRIDAAVVVDPTEQPNRTQVFFGATVTVADEEGSEKTYSIVGVDEIDLKKNRISWVSPLASALLKAEEGQTVSFRSPKGLRELEITQIQYLVLD